jgi:hypothetical protein
MPFIQLLCVVDDFPTLRTAKLSTLKVSTLTEDLSSVSAGITAMRRMLRLVLRCSPCHVACCRGGGVCVTVTLVPL